LIVADFSRRSLQLQLRGDGLCLRTGPVVTRIHSSLAEVVDGIALHYCAHDVESCTSFADFHVSVDRPRGLRRWLHPQVVFRFDGDEPFAPLPGAQGFPMLEWGLNWCIYTHCHQYLTLHSAVLERDGYALILPAPSGSGKSTLCCGLAFRGWRLLSDELAVIEPLSGRVLAIPRPISLKNRSIEVIASFVPEAVFSPPVPDTLKGTVAHVRPPAKAVANGACAALPRWLVLPKFVPDAPAALKPLSRTATFMTLLQNTFNYSVHGHRGFATLAALVERCDCYEFTYGHLSDAVATFERLATANPESA
jgi:HprK-related kinase A